MKIARFTGQACETTAIIVHDRGHLNAEPDVYLSSFGVESHGNCSVCGRKASDARPFRELLLEGFLSVCSQDSLARHK